MIIISLIENALTDAGITIKKTAEEIGICRSAYAVVHLHDIAPAEIPLHERVTVRVRLMAPLRGDITIDMLVNSARQALRPLAADKLLIPDGMGEITMHQEFKAHTAALDYSFIRRG